MCIQGKGAVKVIGSNGYQVDKGGTEIPLKKSLTNPPTYAIISVFPRERKIKIKKEVMTMATKKTVVQMYEEIKAIPGLSAEQIAFLEKRIEITKNKNAKREGADPTPKQKEKMAADAATENAVLSAMSPGVSYNAGDIVKLIDRADVPNTQKLTPRLTALVNDGKVVKSVVKGRSVYSLPSAEGEGD